MKSLVLCDDCQPVEVLKLCIKYNTGIEIQGFFDPNEVKKREELIERLGERITYVHLHDNFGKTDDHEGLGMDLWINALNEHSPAAIWSLECRVDAMEDSIKYLIDNKFYEVNGWI